MWLAFVTDSMLAALFFAAFYSKVSKINNFQLSIASYRLLNEKYLAFAAISVLTAEFLLFVAFASGAVLYIKEIGAIVMLVAFTFSLIWKRSKAKGEATTCTCFGSMNGLNRFPIIRNLILLALVTGKMIVIPFMDQSMTVTLMQLALNALFICGLFIIADVFGTIKQRQKWSLHL
ncbi:MauE/DoxX family redox-associated membrane protein [Paenibacillus sp. GSMTC-2017]|uniref:MauE/DoxX family redox-associated membrane protein n=1 Tax=Paenibacillus sp. GSMTC-2017 TaxID=2794350 RepID=UPI001E3437EA|nr:MauE/DoxX family redox-associated membrane protein [Paenibacillus sp. GSMTC-2017]